MNNLSAFFFLIFIGLFLFFFYSVSIILTPFIVSLILAYFLNPFTKKIEKLGIKRKWTVLVIVALFFILVLLACVKLIPALFAQIDQFITNVPEYKEYVKENFLSKISEYLNHINPEISIKIKNQLNNFSTNFFEYTVTIISNIFNSGLALLNIIGLILFTPILVFYLLRDWPKVIKSTNILIPSTYKKIILEQLKLIDKVLSSYIRGQINVCLIMSLFYVLCFLILELDYALLIGIIIGSLTIMPYIGAIIGFAICSIVALLQFSNLLYLYIIIAIFILGHLLESYIITPKLIGEKVGLHPVWIIFSLMSGGALFGFWGMFFAIPIAAIAGVLIRCLLKLYLESRLFIVE